MKDFDLQKETELLLADRLITHFSSKKYVDWAIKLLINGYESENLCILAGLDEEDDLTIDKYFNKAVEDLNLHITLNSNDLIEKYAVYIAESVITGMIGPEDGLMTMLEIVRATDYSKKYIQFDELQEDLDLYPEYSIFNHAITEENKSQCIYEEFQFFLDVEKLETGSKIRDYVFCNKCKSAGKAVLKKKFLSNRSYWHCPICNSKNILPFSDQEGRKKILEYCKKK
jgi:hypothetical protein